MRRIVLIAIAGLLLLSLATFAQKGSDPISQGDFAALLAGHLNQPVPAGGWNAANATAFLTGLGLVPTAGSWNPTAILTDGDLVHILRLMGPNYFSPDPNAQVTWARAQAVLNRFGDFLHRYNLVARSSDGTTTTHVYTGIASTSSAAPASPSTPH